MYKNAAVEQMVRFLGGELRAVTNNPFSQTSPSYTNKLNSPFKHIVALRK